MSSRVGLPSCLPLMEVALQATCRALGGLGWGCPFGLETCPQGASQCPWELRHSAWPCLPRPPAPHRSQFLVFRMKHSCQNSLPWRESFLFAHEGTETSSFRSCLCVSLRSSPEWLTGFVTLGTSVSRWPEGTLWNSLRLFCVKVPRQWRWRYH